MRAGVDLNTGERFNPAKGLAETPFQQMVVNTAVTFGWKVMHISDSRKQARGELVGDGMASGWPDLVLCRGRRLLFRELKSDRKGARTSPAQEEWIAALLTAGQDAGVWRPSDWPQIQQILEARE